VAARSPIDICNLALGKLGARRITSFDNSSEEAQLCRIEYPHQRDCLLRDHNWNFALARATLPADPVAPAFGYERSYELPADCSRLVEVGERRLRIGDDPYDFDPRGDFIVEGRSILTNREAPLQVRYVRRLTPTELYDDSFVDAIVWHLAAALCMPITQQWRMVPNLQVAAQQSLIRAARANALELSPVALPAPATITERW
jgi:hypothetical protein